MRTKFDEPPLLPPGRHHLNLGSLETLCVTNFANNDVRRELFAAFETFVRLFADLAIPCDMLIDGSFLTEKRDPSDIDVAVRLESDVTDRLTFEQRDLVDHVNEAEQLHVAGVDGFVYTSFPREHPLFSSDIDEKETWAEMYGIEHSKVWLKGMVVLRLGETDVGLRIRR